MTAQTGIRYAGFWRRVGATVIDNLILIPVLGMLSAWLFGAHNDFPSLEDLDPAAIAAVQRAMLQQLVPLLLTLAITVFFWVRFIGTPGKLLLHCHVVDAQTLAPLSISQSLVRYLGYIVSLLPCGLGFLWIAFDARKQGWHDKLAGSVVIVVGAEERVTA